MELLAEGWPMSAAAREVGVSRSAANIWKNGTTVRCKDGTVKIVPPLEPLSVRVISPRFLSEEERVLIADLASRGMGPTAMAKISGGRHRRSVVSCDGVCVRRGSIDRFTQPRQPRAGAVGRDR